MASKQLPFYYINAPSPLTPFLPALSSALIRPLYHSLSRSFSTTTLLKMPEKLTQSMVDSKTDPFVAVQWDDKTPKAKQIEDFYSMVDGMKVGLLTTIRPNIGPVARSMAIAKVHTPNHLSKIKTFYKPNIKANTPSLPTSATDPTSSS